MLVLDANILVRAVLGRHTRALLSTYGDRIDFVAPDYAFREALIRLPAILGQKQLNPAPFLDYFDSLQKVVRSVDRETYSASESVARLRLARRDENDWPILATALALRCPIWTEDTDFFGCGVATWTSDRVEQYLKEELSIVD